MNKQIVQELKNYNFLEKLKINYYVDAKDQNKWKVAKIVNIKYYTHRPTITLRFDGFPTRWNEDFQLPASNKLAPFRRFSLPYTGPLKHHHFDITRDKPDLNFEVHMKELNRLSSIEKMKPEFINQYFRGELFILIDNLLTKKSSLDREDHANAMNLFKAYILAGIKFISFAEENIKQISKQGVTDPNIINVSSKYAAFYALTEFFYNFNSFVNRKESRVNFYTANTLYMPTQQAMSELKKLLLKSNIVELCKNIMAFSNAPYRSYPWSIKKQVLILLKALKSQTEFPSIPDNRQALQILDFINYFKTKQLFSIDFFDKKQIELIISLVISGNFEGRLRGINELKKMVEEVSKYRKEALKESIVKTNLLNFLTDNGNFNGQIFKRSIPVFEFAERYDLLTPEIINRILSLHKDKHELQLKSFYSALCEFGKFLGKDDVLTFFQALTKLPVDEHFITLIKDFTISTIDYHPYYKAKFQSKDTGLGVVYFWKLMESGFKNIPQNLKPLIIEAFSALMVNVFYDHERQKYITAAIYGIRDRKNVDCYLKMIQSSLKIRKSFSIENTIKSLEKQINIIDEVIKAVLEDSKITASGIQGMFEFLQEVSSVAKKGITVEHIKILWRLPDCRSSLLKFMRKYKRRTHQNKAFDKIIYKQLSQQKVKDIILTIFLSSELMEGYRKVSDELYQTADELIVSYNHLNRLIEYNAKHTIHCMKPEELFGINFYSNVAKNCEDSAMSDKATRRLIEFLMRPNPQKSYFSTSQLNLKVNAWIFCLQKIEKLQEKTFSAYKIMLQEIKGRMKSLNILQPTVYNIVVLLKGSNIQKTISLPRYSSLWKLRQVINQEFNLDNTNFEMYYPKIQGAYDMSRQQDYSLALIYPQQDSSNPNVIVTPSKQKHLNYLAIQNFKAHFSNLYGQRLFDYLSVNKSSDQGIILQVLSEIPAIKTIEKKIAKIDISGGWDDILDSQCKAKLSYQIKLIRQMKRDLPWAQSFIKKRGIEHISKILTSKSLHGKMKNEHYQTLTNLLEIFCHILKFFRLQKTCLPFEESFVIELVKIHSSNLSPEIIEYYYEIFKVIRQIVNYSQLRLERLMNHEAFKNTLQVVLFSKVDYKKWERFPQIILEIADKLNSIPTLLSHIDHFLHIPMLVRNRSNCKMYFNMLMLLFQKNVVTQNLFKKVSDFISHIKKDHQYVQEDEDECDELLYGWLCMLNCLILKNITTGNKVKLFYQPQSEIATFLLKDCLFDAKHRLKSKQCRSEAFQILSNMSCETEVTDLTNEMVVPMMLKGSWRKQFEWNVKAFKKRKSGYVGLKNLAATCYINSLLQQLFFIKSFREPLLSFNTKDIDEKQNIAYEIQKVFAHLKYSDSDIFATISLCNTFILDGQPIDPRIQTDVDEFFHTLMDKLQRDLLKIKKKELIDSIFRGEYSNLIIGQQCPHKSQRIQHFLSMRLQILEKRSLSQALDDFIKGEILQGDNAYFCDKCDRKVKALKRVCVKELPNILILALKRFQFNFDTMERFKLNSFCEFPEELDMLPYMRETLFQDEEKQPLQNYKFVLKGVLIHYGISQAGHYTSYVKIDGEWKYFDDEKIYDFDASELGNECFGGVEENPYGDDEQKLKNAYLLIYEKVSMNDQKVKMKVDKGIHSQVQNQNMKNQLVKTLFEEGFEKFMNQKSMKMKRTFLIYVHLVILRSQNKTKLLSSIYEKCIQILQNKEIADWYLNQMSQSFIREFLIYGCYEARFFVSSLVIHCVHLTFNPDFIKRCIKSLQKTYMVPLNKIFQAASSHSQYLKVLNEYSLGQKVYRIIKQDKEPALTSAISKIADVRSEFGNIPPEYIEKKDRRDVMQLFSAIQNLKINISQQDLQMFSSKAKKTSVQLSLAKVVSQKYKEKEKFNELIKTFLGPKLVKLQPKLDQEHCYSFLIILIMAFCEIKDELSNDRVKTLAELYLMALKESMQGYKAMRLLLEGLFNIGFNHQNFRDEFLIALNSVKDSKKIIRGMREWIKEGDKMYSLVRSGKLQYWRKPTRYHSTQSQLSQVENDGKIKPQSYSSLLNSLLEKHNIDFENQWRLKARAGDQVLLLSEYVGVLKYKVVSVSGSLLQISNIEVPQRFIFEEDVHFILRP